LGLSFPYTIRLLYYKYRSWCIQKRGETLQKNKRGDITKNSKRDIKKNLGETIKKNKNIKKPKPISRIVVVAPPPAFGSL